MAKLIYSHQQEKITFNFYVDDNGKLIGETAEEGKLTQALEINGFPQSAFDLTKPEDEQKAISLLKESFFKKNGFGIQVYGRLAGGWDEWQHAGYEEEEPDGSGKLIYYYPTQGTYIWATEVFEGVDTFNDDKNNKSCLPAKKIAAYDDFVDYGNTSPTNLIKNGEFKCQNEIKITQGWHFNTNEKAVGGMAGDSRTQHAVDQLLFAVELHKEKCPEASLKAIGTGLHPLQDVFAHTDFFTKKYYFKGKNNKEIFFYGHIPVSSKNQEEINLQNIATKAFKSFITENVSGQLHNADNPYYIYDKEHSYESVVDEDIKNQNDKIKEVEKNKTILSPEVKERKLNQRYSDTKTVSYLYLYLYKLLTGGKQDKAIEDKITNRIKQSLAKYRPNQGTHAIGGLIEAITKNKELMNCILKNDPARKFLDNLTTETEIMDMDWKINSQGGIEEVNISSNITTVMDTLLSLFKPFKALLRPVLIPEVDEKKRKYIEMVIKNRKMTKQFLESSICYFMPPEESPGDKIKDVSDSFFDSSIIDNKKSNYDYYSLSSTLRYAGEEHRFFSLPDFIISPTFNENSLEFFELYNENVDRIFENKSLFSNFEDKDFKNIDKIIKEKKLNEIITTDIKLEKNEEKFFEKNKNLDVDKQEEEYKKRLFSTATTNTGSSNSKKENEKKQEKYKKKRKLLPDKEKKEKEILEEKGKEKVENENKNNFGTGNR